MTVGICAAPWAAADQASPAVCADRLRQVQAGNTKNPVNDVQWLLENCPQATKDSQISAMGDAALDAAMRDAQATSKAAAAAAQSGVSAAHAEANGGIGREMLSGMSNAPPPTAPIGSPGGIRWPAQMCASALQAAQQSKRDSDNMGSAGHKGYDKNDMTMYNTYMNAYNARCR
jgi:hypothetical protein